MQININEIMGLLPHRYPFLLVDRIEEVIDTVGAVLMKMQKEFQTGERKLVYLTSIDNAKFRKGAVLMKMQKEFQTGERKLVYLTSIDNAKFRKPVKPGDQLRTTARLKRRRGSMGKFEFVATVDGEIVAQAEMGFHIASGLTLEAEDKK